MKCFYNPKDHLACLIVLWFEPEAEPIPLNPEIPLELSKIVPGERVYILNDAVSHEQISVIETITETIWIAPAPKAEILINELVWRWFSEDPMPDKLYITFNKPHAHYLAIDIA